MPSSAPQPATPTYRERLSPGPATYGAIALFCLFVFIMIVIASLPIAAGVSLLLLVGGSVFAYVTSPVVTVADGVLSAGAAHIPARLLGAPTILDRAGVREAMGPSYDPRMFACLRGATGAAVVIDVLDPADPTPSWLVSTRHPEALAAAVREAAVVG